MIYICSYCGDDLRAADDTIGCFGANTISHGICRPCKAVALTDIRAGIFDSPPADIARRAVALVPACQRGL